MIFCKSKNFLQETEDSLKSHVEFINTIFGVELQKYKNDILGMPWFISTNRHDVLYFSGHTGDAILLLNNLHSLYAYGVGSQIQDVYLNTCSAKPTDSESKPQPKSSSGIVFVADMTDEEKRKLKINDKPKFIELDGTLKKVKDLPFNVHLCKQDLIEDENVNMARFLPMDECRLGFSPTQSELTLHGYKGSLAEKLEIAFDDVSQLL
ncbi:MAG: hypothetical protein FWH17_11425 [Oscillospiraceae bacterium]|nr:hypothetical protein [Oscillospiraceae bacterium]